MPIVRKEVLTDELLINTNSLANINWAYELLYLPLPENSVDDHQGADPPKAEAP